MIPPHSSDGVHPCWCGQPAFVTLTNSETDDVIGVPAHAEPVDLYVACADDHGRPPA